MGVLQFGARNVEGEVEHPGGEIAMCFGVVDEAGEAVGGSDLCGYVFGLEELVCGNLVVAQKAFERTLGLHLSRLDSEYLVTV